jgi:hypothetical protein
LVKLGRGNAESAQDLAHFVGINYILISNGPSPDYVLDQKANLAGQFTFSLGEMLTPQLPKILVECCHGLANGFLLVSSNYLAHSRPSVLREGNDVTET